MFFFLSLFRQTQTVFTQLVTGTSLTPSRTQCVSWSTWSGQKSSNLKRYIQLSDMFPQLIKLWKNVKSVRHSFDEGFVIGNRLSLSTLTWVYLNVFSAVRPFVHTQTDL